MKNIKFLIISLTILTLSCQKEFIDKKPTNKITAELILSNTQGLDLILNGAYRTLGHYYLDALWYQALADVKGGDVVMASSVNYGWFISMYQYNITNTSYIAEEPWNRAYAVIDEANTILSVVDETPGTQADLDRIKGEAYGLRGYSYLLLANMFSNKPYAIDATALSVPIRLEPYDAANDPSLPRSTVQEVYTQIIADLTLAEGLCVNGAPSGKFSNQAIQGMLARAYLDMENWTQASNWAQACSAGEVLTAGNYTDGFYNHNTETVFGYHFTATDHHYYRSHPSFWYIDNASLTQELYGYSTVMYTPEFVALFDPADIRNLFMPGPWADFFGASGTYVTYKFQHRNNSLSLHDFVRMRVGEMFLIEAEAEANLINSANAQAALFIVQDRAGYGAVVSTNTGQALLDEIYLERRKELYGEGFAAFDLMRLGLPVDRSSSLHWGYTATTIAQNADVMSLPIPQSEIDANDLITVDDQNDGY